MLCYDDDDYIPLVEMTIAESSQTALSQSDDVLAVVGTTAAATAEHHSTQQSARGFKRRQ